MLADSGGEGQYIFLVPLTIRQVLWLECGVRLPHPSNPLSYCNQSPLYISGGSCVSFVPLLRNRPMIILVWAPSLLLSKDRLSFLTMIPVITHIALSHKCDSVSCPSLWILKCFLCTKEGSRHSVKFCPAVHSLLHPCLTTGCFLWSSTMLPIFLDGN